jgi:aminomethyltransferase
MTEGSVPPSLAVRDAILRDLMTDTDQELKQTPLHALHLELGGKMVAFAGYAMPVQYPAGILKEHLHTREKAGLFDVSHMGQAFLGGPDPGAALERVTPADIQGIGEGMQRYGLLLNDAGGIKDDFMTTRLAGEAALYLVVNAAMKESDFAYIAQRLKGVADLQPAPDRALLALQGPLATDVLERHSPGISQLTFMQAKRVTVAGAPAIVSRTGYTGEDGFEIYAAPGEARRIWYEVLTAGREFGIKPCGLGARNTLRLEAKMALYGHEIHASITPFEADLNWIVKMDKGDFQGREALAKQKGEGIKRKLVGFEMTGRGIGRDGYEVYLDGAAAGWVTSGGPSPTLNKNIGLCYLPVDRAVPGQKIEIMIRNQPVEAVTVPTPFYKRAK